MSLEIALNENTAAINKLLAAWDQLTAIATARHTAPAEKEAPAKAKAKVEAPAATVATAPVDIAPIQEAAPVADAVDFETVKKAFLALSVKDGGRARCEAVLKPFSLAKLSEAKPEQYAAILGAIQKASV